VNEIPSSLLDSLEKVVGFDRQAFIKAHLSGEPVTSVRIHPRKFSSINSQFSFADPVPWSQYGYYLNERPSFTFDPCFHAGCYYVQEASSMFLEQALKQTVDLTQPIKVLDLCAAPGGKSTHIQSLISKESLLVSNEVIKSRVSVLKQNIIKWGFSNIIVTNNDPKHFERLGGFFDVIVVDAPCSGSGLFRRGESSVNEWSFENVQLCFARQQRILADILPVLKENGILIYSTCSYSKEENEDIEDWLVKEMKLKNEKLSINKDWGIIETISEKTKSYGYRFFPDKVKGEGFYLSLFRKEKETKINRFKIAKPEMISLKERQFLESWLKKDDYKLIKHSDRVFAFPASLIENLLILQSCLYLHYAGTAIGEIIRDKLIPDHALALSPLISEQVSRVEVDYNTAIAFLQKKEITVISALRGWQLVSFENVYLGWINVLPNRINNYYPKEMRILKSHIH
jgi:16S rRNA C967 or C1407 C5-methylase (RsmB/RsmF family)/NOL1/NOP2/fmu family ribosome biogenesis protein